MEIRAPVPIEYKTLYPGKQYLYIDDFDALSTDSVLVCVPRRGLYMLKVLIRYARQQGTWVKTIYNDYLYEPVDDEDFDDILATVAETEGGLMTLCDNVLADVTLTENQQDIHIINLDYNDTGPWDLMLNLVNPLGSTVGVSFFVNYEFTATDYYTQVLWAVNGNRTSTRNNNALCGWIGANKTAVSTGIVIKDAEGTVTYLEHQSRYGGSLVDGGIRYVSTAFTETNITSIHIHASLLNGLGEDTRILLTKRGA